jgi:hypothetical protein
LLPQVGLATVHVRQHQREVCRLSPRGYLASGPTRGSTPIRSITERPSLAPSSPTRRPMGFSYESLSHDVKVEQAATVLWQLARPCGKTTGLPRSTRAVVVCEAGLSSGVADKACPTECGLGRVYPPVARQLRWGSSKPHGPGHVPFWSKRFSSLRLANMTTVATLYLS